MRRGEERSKAKIEKFERMERIGRRGGGDEGGEDSPRGVMNFYPGL